ncbi:hypothetical protein GCM10009863_08670 [Streptomyces axinellae]|uniref:Uncharacterized protein n=1 Tax=Streptomyces axinellae TaxID=552788 RepID=A0ABN3PQI8_9ACTN
MAMGRHGDGKEGQEGDQKQPPKESDGKWERPIPPDKDPDER